MTFPGPSECAKVLRQYSILEAEDILKSMVDIKPKVIKDFMAIRDKFPCNSQALKCLKSLVSERF